MRKGRLRFEDHVPVIPQTHKEPFVKAECGDELQEKERQVKMPAKGPQERHVLILLDHCTDTEKRKLEVKAGSWQGGW